MESNPDHRPRVVATYTTLPSRYEVLKLSIQSLKAQTYPLDAIYVTLPQKATRLNKEYPPLPEDLAALCTVVRSETDYGPITKIYGGLVSEQDPNTVIISCDDDVHFPPNFVEILMQHHKTHPKSVLCGTGALIGKGLPLISIVSTVHPFQSWRGFIGFDLDKRGRKVDLIFGVAGVLYTRGCFPANEELHDILFQHSLKESSIFHNDDVLISGYLSKQGIERRVFSDIPVIKHYNGADALSADMFRMIMRLNESIGKVKELGYFSTMEDMAVDETPAWRGVAAVILIILVILLIWCLWRLS